MNVITIESADGERWYRLHTNLLHCDEMSIFIFETLIIPLFTKNFLNSNTINGFSLPNDSHITIQNKRRHRDTEN